MSNSEYRAPPNDMARYDMQKELLGTNVTVKLLQRLSNWEETWLHSAPETAETELWRVEASAGRLSKREEA